MKIGRNDPCPCGSGKKYKRCCLGKAAGGASTQERTRDRVRDELNSVRERVLEFIRDRYGSVAIAEAWQAFVLHEPEADLFSFESPHMPVFVAWMFFHWAPEPDATTVEDPDLHGQVPMQAWLQRKGRSLSGATRAYLESCLQSEFRYYEVREGEGDGCLQLVDMLEPTQCHELSDPDARQILQPDSVAFLLLGHTEGITLVESFNAVPFEEDAAAQVHNMVAVLDELAHGQPDAEQQKRNETEVFRRLYFDLMDAVRRTREAADGFADGMIGPAVFTAYYDIDSMQEALEALRYLAETDEDLVIERDAQDNLQLVRILCGDPEELLESTGGVSAGDTGEVPVGEIELTTKGLTVQTFSSMHADWFDDLIGEALGERAAFVHEEIETIDEALDALAVDDELDALLEVPPED